jgi:nucleoside-diphosphate-sugar epimerase
MKRILVTGGSGFVGQAVVARLQAEGYIVRIATRRPAMNLQAEHVAVGNIGPRTNWQQALDKVDGVIHLAARIQATQDVAANPLDAFRSVNTAGTRRLAESIMLEGPRPFVFMSSIKALGPINTSQPLTEAGKLFKKPAPTEPYGISKREAELAIAETGLPATIFRPPLVYGPGVKGNVYNVLRYLWYGVPMPLGLIRNRRSVINVENLAGAIITALNMPEIWGTYVVHDGAALSTPDFVRQMGIALNRPARLWSIPPTLLRTAGAVMGKSAAVERVLSSLEIDDATFRTVSGWQPGVSTSEGMHNMAKWFRSLHS